MNIPTEYAALLSASGISLDALGLRDVALSRADALLAVNMLRDSVRVILGGDVYHRRDGRLEPALANWYSDPKQAEARLSYLQRSWDTTEKYLKAYPERPGIEPLFSIVIGESEPVSVAR